LAFPLFIISFSLHQLFRCPDVVDIHDVISPLHRIRPMTQNPHAHHLKHSGAPHVSDGCPPKIMEFQGRHSRGVARLLPRTTKLLKRNSSAMTRAHNHLRSHATP
jgi:hypothetical protein